MRIMLITGKYPPQQCGIGDYTHRLSEELNKRGHQTIILTSMAEEGRGKVTEKQEKEEVMRQVLRWDSRAYPIILSCVRKNNIDLVHIQFHAVSFNCHPMITLLPLLLRIRRTLNRAKVVVTLHELAGPITTFFPGPSRRLWLLPLVFLSDAVIVSNEHHLSLLRNVPFLNRRLHFIPLAPTIDVSRPVDRSTVRRQVGVIGDEILIVKFGFVQNIQASFTPELLQAIKRLRDRGYRVRLLLVGGENSECHAAIVSLARSLGIAERVHLTGYCSAEEVSQYLTSADIGVQLYPDGVSGNRCSLYAAMLHGLPIVSLRKGHVPSCFINRETILLISRADPEHIAQGLEELIVDTKLRDKLRENAVGAIAGFNWGTICEQTDKLYGSLIESPKRYA